MPSFKTLNGQPLSKLAFGTMQFGPPGADEPTSHAVYDACRAAGINHFDTANGYTEGQSETMLGRFARAERGDVFVATKVGYVGGSGRANLTAQFDTSRKRLGMDAVDLLYVHIFDPDTALRETMETLAGFRADGLVRHIGLSNFSAWQVMKAQWVASEFDMQIDAIQPMYSLVKRQAEVEILPMAADQGIGAFTYSPLGGGVLTGKYASDPDGGRLTWDARYKKRYALAGVDAAVSGLMDIANARGVHPATLAVAWAARHPFVTAPLISGRSTDQIAPSLAAAEFAMDDTLYAQIAALFPAPPPATDRNENT